MRVLALWRKLAPVCLGVAALAVTNGAWAQHPMATEVQTMQWIGSGCPVSMTAAQRSAAQRVETGSLLPERPAQGLTVTLAGRRALRIVSAEVVAHALSGRNRALLTSNTAAADVTRTFQLAAKDSGGFSADLWVEGVTSIRWIEVKSLTYSDGSVWHESETQRCSVKPDPVVLISSIR